MRVSTLNFYSQGVIAMQEQQAKLQETELQIASGLRINKPSDDPSAAVKVLDLKAGLDTLDQYSRNSALAQSSLAFEESVVANVNNTLQRIRELAVQGNNSTYQDRDKQSIAQEIYQRLDELVALANTKDAQGDYIFGGYKVDSPPFVELNGSVVYRGDQGQRMLQVGDGSMVATRDSGMDVFQRVRSGDGNISVQAAETNVGTAIVGAFGLVATFQPDDYTVTFDQASPAAPITYEVTDSSAGVVATGTYSEGSSISFGGAQFDLSGTPAPGDQIMLSPSSYQDIFTTVKNIADALNAPAPDNSSRAQFHNLMGQGLANLDQALDNVTAIRADVGARLNNLETLEEINQDFKLQMETVLSDTQDLDYAEAISRFNLQLTALQAAQQAYVKASGLSLFQFL
ncbi:MAG: flagellar hook-associated protein FlgL [Pseudomonadales bacterium]|nr:flagellar hook-associated protein FlgL [Pseudomonadales bacterium]